MSRTELPAAPRIIAGVETSTRALERQGSLRGAADRAWIGDRAAGAARDVSAGRPVSRQGPRRSRRGRDPGDRARRAPARRAGTVPVRAVHGGGVRRQRRRVPRASRPMPARDLYEPGHGPLRRLRRGDRRAAGEHVHARASARGSRRAGRDSEPGAAAGRGAVRLGTVQPARARPGHPDRAGARVRAVWSRTSATRLQGRARSSSSSWRRCGWGSERGPAPSTWWSGSSSRRACSATSSSSTSRWWCSGRAAVLRAGASTEPRARGTRPLPVRVRGRGPRRHRVTPRCDRGGARAARLAGASGAPRAQANPIGGAELAVPAAELPALADTPLPQRSMSTGERWHARELGGRLAVFRAFAGLSDSERTTLRTFATEDARRPGRRDRRSRRGRPRARPDRSRARPRSGQAAAGAGRDRAWRVPGRGRRARRCRGAGQRGRQHADAHPARAGGRVPVVPARAARRRARAAAARTRRGPKRRRQARARSASNTAETQAALRAVGAAERDPALRNPDWMAARLVTAQPRLTALAKVPGAPAAPPAARRATGAGRIPLRDRARQAHRRRPRRGAAKRASTSW